MKLKIYHVCMNAETVPFFPLNKPNSSKGYPSPSGKILLDNWISLFSYPHSISLTVSSTNDSCLSSSSIDPNATRIIFSDSGRWTTEARALWKRKYKICKLVPPISHHSLFAEFSVCMFHLINIWQMFNVETDAITAKPYIQDKSLFQLICCKCLAW